MESNESFRVSVRCDPADEHRPVPRPELTRKDGLERKGGQRDESASDESDDARSSNKRKLTI